MLPMRSPVEKDPPAHAPRVFAESAWRATGFEGGDRGVALVSAGGTERDMDWAAQAPGTRRPMSTARTGRRGCKEFGCVRPEGCVSFVLPRTC
ncbi:MAG: hypothetical protein BRD43_07465 [Bacteroidetes bacterium QS_4_64_154]|nr:MAG: hypothetical protein BRD43_07465 [Bacteroidetes bacterium QS_4_64_154]